MTSFQLSEFGVLVAVAALVSALVTLLAWQNRDERGGVWFTALMAALTLWATGDALQTAGTTLPWKLLWRSVGYVGHNVVPLAFLGFALAYTRREEWITTRNAALVAAEPLAVALAFTPTNALGMHSLVWETVSLTSVDGTVILTRSFGALYWLNTAYNYLLVLVALVLFVRLSWETHGSARRQGYALVAGAVPPFVANVAWVAGLTPVDATPVAFTVTGLVFGYAIFRYHLLELVPVARKTVLDAARDGYVVVDSRGRLVDVNATASETLDVDDGDVGRSAATALPRVAALLERHRRTGEDVEGEIELDAAGDPRAFQVTVTSLDAADGGLLVLLRDVTERRDVERRFQALIENSSDLITVLDSDGVYTYVSPSSRRILDYEPDALVGDSAFEAIHPDDREDVRQTFEEAVENPDRTPTAEYRIRRNDGAWRWLESRGRNLLSDSAVEGFVVNSRDVTERKRRESRLRRQNERLDAFASVVSHDLRNPLNVVEGRIEIARETGDASHLEAAARAADRMGDLIDDLLTLARHGEQVGETDPVDLRVAARQAWGNVATEEATLDVADSRVVAADTDRLSQLFENLFRNAVEHVGDGVTVRVGTLPDGFFVEDDGPGVPPDEREAVFDHGYSTADRGTGFGLSIVRTIATAHGWDVRVTDGENGGARFEVTGVDPEEVDDDAEEPPVSTTDVGGGSPNDGGSESREETGVVEGSGEGREETEVVEGSGESREGTGGRP
ncbi:MAG: histidine kinase N-terminal 7TM domain-containing protein [Haloferacaceae archaeon]